MSPRRFCTFPRHLLTSLLLLGSLSCRDEAKPAPRASPSISAPSASATSVEAGPWAEWDMPARRAAWQGIHVMPGAGDPWIAIDVRGETAKIWDGTAETSGEISLYGPCNVGMPGYGTGMAKNGFVGTYTIENGELVTGLGNAGSKKGSKAVACVMGKVLTLDENGTCLERQRKPLHPTEYDVKPGSCGWGTRDGGTVFEATVSKIHFVLEVHGDALYDQQLAGRHSRRVSDWAAAKAARAKP